jgi:hypothetical protein
MSCSRLNAQILDYSHYPAQNSGISPEIVRKRANFFNVISPSPRRASSIVSKNENYAFFKRHVVFIRGGEITVNR